MGSRKGCGPDATEPQTAAQNGRGGREGGPQPRSPPQSRPAAPRGTAERGRGRGDRDVQKVNPRPPAGFPPSPMGPWRSSPLTGGAQKPSISSVFTPFGRNPGHLATSQIRTRRLGHLASLQTWPPHNGKKMESLLVHLHRIYVCPLTLKCVLCIGIHTAASF